jgi:hypothetical protein
MLKYKFLKLKSKKDIGRLKMKEKSRRMKKGPSRCEYEIRLDHPQQTQNVVCVWGEKGIGVRHMFDSCEDGRKNWGFQ